MRFPPCGASDHPAGAPRAGTGPHGPRLPHGGAETHRTGPLPHLPSGCARNFLGPFSYGSLDPTSHQPWGSAWASQTGAALLSSGCACRVVGGEQLENPRAATGTPPILWGRPSLDGWGVSPSYPAPALTQGAEAPPPRASLGSPFVRSHPASRALSTWDERELQGTQVPGLEGEWQRGPVWAGGGGRHWEKRQGRPEAGMPSAQPPTAPRVPGLPGHLNPGLRPQGAPPPPLPLRQQWCEEGFPPGLTALPDGRAGPTSSPGGNAAPVTMRGLRRREAARRRTGPRSHFPEDPEWPQEPSLTGLVAARARPQGLPAQHPVPHPLVGPELLRGWV